MNNIDKNIHALRIFPQYFKCVKNGTKTFEIRKNDRDFHKGDILQLYEYDKAKGLYTGRVCAVTVLYVLKNCDGLSKDYCIMSIERI